MTFHRERELREERHLWLTNFIYLCCMLNSSLFSEFRENGSLGKGPHVLLCQDTMKHMAHSNNDLSSIQTKLRILTRHHWQREKRGLVYYYINPAHIKPEPPHHPSYPFPLHLQSMVASSSHLLRCNSCLSCVHLGPSTGHTPSVWSWIWTNIRRRQT